MHLEMTMKKIDGTKELVWKDPQIGKPLANLTRGKKSHHREWNVGAEGMMWTFLNMSFKWVKLLWKTQHATNHSVK